MNCHADYYTPPLGNVDSFLVGDLETAAESQSPMMPGRVCARLKVEKIVKLMGGKAVSNAPGFPCTLPTGSMRKLGWSRSAPVTRYSKSARWGAPWRTQCAC